MKLLKGLKHPYETISVNLILRDVGRNFSDLRDAHVRQILLLELKNQSNGTPYLSMIEQFEKQNHTEIESAEYSMLVVQNEFFAFQEMWTINETIDPYFDIKSSDSLKILDVFASSYLKSFAAFNTSVDSSDPNLLHEWRKRLKDVQYQYELLFDNLNSEIQKHYLKIQDLCNMLGELNDWDMMNHWITNNQNHSMNEGHLISMLSDEILDQQKALLGDSRANGRELYAYTPDQFKNQLF